MTDAVEGTYVLTRADFTTLGGAYDRFSIQNLLS